MPGAYAQKQAGEAADTQCLACHGQAGLKNATGRSVYVNQAKHKASVHSVLGCTSCHTDIQDFPHPARVQKVECSACHAEEGSKVQASIHSALGGEGCTSCHGEAHGMGRAADLVPQKCGACHTAEVRRRSASCFFII
jgi:protein-arginine kinase activator protein McsA